MGRVLEIGVCLAFVLVSCQALSLVPGPDKCVSCTENVCARVRIICKEGTVPTPNFCKCTCECKPPKPVCNPCAALKCKKGYSCISNRKTCTGTCQRSCRNCRSNPNPCQGVTCKSNKVCVAQCYRCRYRCVSRRRCFRNPCSGAACGKNERCVPNFKQCTHKCESCIRACPLIYAPVCGSDGKTYGNDCAFKAAVCRSKRRLTKRHNGKCKACRNVCPKLLRRVCGSNGVTYNNECLLKLASCRSRRKITKRSNGRCSNCRRLRCSRLFRPVCGSDGNTYRNSCVLRLIRCRSGRRIRKVHNGICKSKVCRRGCPKILRPVCGSDGKTYSNECLLKIAICKSGNKITKRSNGKCPESCSFPNPCVGVKCAAGKQCVANVKECSYSCQAKCNPDIRCIVAACQFSSPCESGDKCLATCNGCVPECEIKRASCRPGCPKILRPVCGSNGITYNNECLLKFASCTSGRSIIKKSDGRCSKQCPDVCIQIFKPVCGSDGKTHSNACFLGIAICKSGNKITQVGDGPCPDPCNKPCQKIFVPVCGTDGKTYDNECSLKNAICASKKNGEVLMKAKDGPCPRCVKDCNTDRLCSTIFCVSGTVPVKNKCLCTCTCQKQCPGACPLFVRPVCGSDGKTYSNACFLGIASCKSGNKITQVRDGPCRKQCPGACPLFVRPVCGSDGKTYSNACFLGIASCKSGNKITQVRDGPCPTKCIRPCKLDFDPVCGSDGVTYSNQCHFEVAFCESGGKLTKVNDGICVSLTPCDPCKCRKCGFNEICVADKKSCSSVCTKRCPPSIPVMCLIAPCSINNCKKDELCVADCQPCSSVCLKKKSDINPCLFTKCGSGQKCVVDGCRSKCVDSTCKKGCPEIFAPVCGTDGQTYNNECLLKLASCESGKDIKKKSDGKCPTCSDPCASKTCNLREQCVTNLNTCTAKCVPPVCSFDPCIATTCLVGNDCVADLKTCVGRCVPRKCDKPCENQVRYVCASDGRTYLNECELNNAICKSDKKLSKLYEGICADDYRRLKGLNLKPVCSTDGKTYSNKAFLDIFNCLTGQTNKVAFNNPCECKKDIFCTADTCLANYDGARFKSCSPKCLPTPCARPPVPEPLFCGTDGVTYTNCALTQARCKSDGKIRVRHGGPCKERICPECKNLHSPVCGSDKMTYTSDCHIRREICLRGDNSLKKVHNGPCRGAFAEIFGADFKTVCASDREVYSNDAYVGLQRCWKNVVTIKCSKSKSFPKCFAVLPKPHSSSKPKPSVPQVCGHAITLFCTNNCKSCCVSTNTCAPAGFPKVGFKCGFESPFTTI